MASDDSPPSRTPTDAADRCVRKLSFDQGVYAVDWSPDGTRFAIGDRVGGVEVLTAEGRRLWRRVEHQRGVFDVRWSPGGRRLASESQDGTLRIWDVQDGSVQVVCQIPNLAMPISWTPDDRHLACVSYGYGVIIFDSETGEGVESWIVPGERAWGTGWSPDGSYLAVGFLSGQIRLRNEQTHHEIGPFEGHTRPVRQLAWTRDSQRLASASYDNTVRIWNVAERSCALVLEGHRGTLDALSWSPDGTLLASGASDRTVRIWSSENGEEAACLDGHTDIVFTVAFSPDGTRVASAGDETVRIWDVSDLYPVRPGRDVSASFDDYVARQAATVGRRARRTAPSLWVPRLPRRGTNEEQASASGDVLGELERMKKLLPGGVAILPDSRSLVMGQEDRAVHRVDLVSGDDLWVSEREDHAIGEIACSRLGSFIASCAWDTVSIWQSTTGKRVSISRPGRGQFSGEDAVEGVCFAPGEDYIAMAHSFLGIVIWNIDTSTLETRYSCSGRSLDWSPDGDLIASSSGSIRDAFNGSEIHHFDSGSGFSEVAWSQDGSRLAAAHDAAVTIWDRGTWKQLTRCEGHESATHHVAWSPDGRLLASGSYDKTVRIWDTETGREVHRFSVRDGGSAKYLSWSPNGAFLAASLNLGTVRLWDVRKHLRPRRRSQLPASQRRALPPGLEPLPGAFAHLTRLGLPFPLSHLHILLRILGGGSVDDATLESLTSQPGIRKLAALRWPVKSRPGLVALLLEEVPRHDEWKPPPGATPTQLRDALAEALSGETCTPDAPPLPTSALLRSTDAVDERLLTLLELVGPDAVAADPGLPLRLLPRVSKLPPLAASKRRLLGLRLRLDRGGPAHGHGGGAERTGIDVRGDWRAVLPWQLALPDDVLRGRYLRNEILYRARSGEEPPRLRPTVLVLDVSPPTFGPVERSTRLAAHVVASTLLEAGLPVVLVTAGGRPTVRTLERRSDLVDLWTLRSQEGADEAVTVRVARAMRETLAGEELSPVVVLLSHVFFGADEDVEDVPGLRGLFVQYPGRTVRPPMAEACERWESVGAGEVEGLEERLGRLVG